MEKEALTEEEERADTLAAHVLILAVDRGYRSMDVFATWFVGGTGAMVGLILAGGNLASRLVPAGTLQAVLFRVTVAFGCVLAAKFIGSLICARAGGLGAVVQQMKDWRDTNSEPVSQEDYNEALQRCLPWWMRKLQKLRPPTPANLARRTLWECSIAGALTLSACAIVVSVWFELAVSL